MVLFFTGKRSINIPWRHYIHMGIGVVESLFNIFLQVKNGERIFQKNWWQELKNINQINENTTEKKNQRAMSPNVLILNFQLLFFFSHLLFPSFFSLGIDPINSARLAIMYRDSFALMKFQRVISTQVKSKPIYLAYSLYTQSLQCVAPVVRSVALYMPCWPCET